MIVPSTSRFMRVISGVVQRLKGRVDTHVTSIELLDGVLSAKRWFYRQRLEATLGTRGRWFLLLE